MRRTIAGIPAFSFIAAIAAAALAAFSAGRNAGIYAAVMASGATLAYFIAAHGYFAIKAELRAQQRVTDEQRRLISMGRRARWIMLTVRDHDGNLYANTLEQILTDATPEGRDLLWDTPDAAALWYMDPDDIYREEEHGSGTGTR